VQDKKAKLAAVQDQVKESEDKLMNAQKVFVPLCGLPWLIICTQRMMTAEEKASQLEKICQAEEIRNAAILKELNGLRDVQFKQNEQVYSLKQQDQTTMTAIQCLSHSLA
jgi:hypothetical protein